jgi:hypothetical protein
VSDIDCLLQTKRNGRCVGLPIAEMRSEPIMQSRPRSSCDYLGRLN